MNIVVKKFGGTSVGSIERIEQVAQRIYEDKQKGQNPVIIASAMSGETNRLVGLAYQMDRSNKGPAYDMLVASGEQVSISLLAMALEKKGLKAKPLLAYQLGIKTNDKHSKARIQSIDSNKLKSLIADDIIPVVAGFQGMTESGEDITTLGRGGSDTSAVAVAAALDCKACEIYTDVSGVYTADPRVVSGAKKIGSLSYEETMEMASLGSKVLHFRCVELAAKYGVGLHVRSTFEATEGTWILKEKDMDMEAPVVSSVTHEKDTSVLKISPMSTGTKNLAKLFMALAEKNVVIDIITQSEIEGGQSLAFSLPTDDVLLAQEVLSAMGFNDKTEILDNVSKVSVVGVGMRNHPGVAARYFKALDSKNIDVQLVTTSDIKISSIVPKDKMDEAIKAVHFEFFGT